MMADNACVHKRIDRGVVYESCLDCGAIRKISNDADAPWHICDLCRYPVNTKAKEKV